MKEEGGVEGISDGELIAKVKAGELGSFNDLVRRYQKRIYSLALKMTRNHDIADEVVQVAFVKAYRSIHRFKEGSPFYPWIYRIAVNICMTHFKRAKSLVPLPENQEIPFTARTENPHTNPERSLEEGESMKRLEFAIDSLPADWKTVLILRAQENLSYEEISKVLKIPIGTVMSRLSRARERLKEMLSKFEI